MPVSTRMGLMIGAGLVMQQHKVCKFALILNLLQAFLRSEGCPVHLPGLSAADGATGDTARFTMTVHQLRSAGFFEHHTSDDRHEPGTSTLLSAALRSAAVRAGNCRIYPVKGKT